jgi:hypothetical protein
MTARCAGATNPVAPGTASVIPPTMTRPRQHSHGSPLCQEAAGSGDLGSVVSGRGRGLSQELVWGCEAAALESEPLPRCHPRPVRDPAKAWVIASSSMAM